MGEYTSRKKVKVLENVLEEILAQQRSMAKKLEKFINKQESQEPNKDSYKKLEHSCSNLMKVVGSVLGFIGGKALFPEQEGLGGFPASDKKAILNIVNTGLVTPFIADNLCSYAIYFLKAIIYKLTFHETKKPLYIFTNSKSEILTIKPTHDSGLYTADKFQKVDGSGVGVCKYIIINFNQEEGDIIDFSQFEAVGRGDLYIVDILMEGKLSKAIHIHGVEPEFLVCLYNHNQELKETAFNFISETKDEL